MDGVHRLRRRRSISILATSAIIATAGLALPGPSAVAVTESCRARNLTQAAGYRSNLQRVIDRANPGDRILIERVCVGPFVVDKDLSLVGDTTAKRRVLHGDGAGTVLTVDTATVRLVGLAITGGVTDSYGGGIYDSGGTVILGRGVVVRGNVARNGGGIYGTADATLILRRGAVVRRNVATSSGGGIYGAGATFLRTGAVVRDNEATNDGGGIVANGANEWPGVLVLEGSARVSGNTAGKGGGGIYNYHGAVTLKDSSTVMGNAANSGGGIANSSGATLTLRGSSSVSGNTATWGGGISNSVTEASVLLKGSSVVSGNTATSGGGVNNSGTLVLEGSAAVSGNTASAGGGGIYNHGTLILDGSSAVGGNVAGSSGGIQNYGAGTSLTLRRLSTVIGNQASVYGGVSDAAGAVTFACDGSGVDGWKGAISPNTPDNVPTVYRVTCPE
jgi:predicted outer membrane repeat protein